MYIKKYVYVYIYIHILYINVNIFYITIQFFLNIYMHVYTQILCKQKLLFWMQLIARQHYFVFCIVYFYMKLLILF